MSKEAPVTLAAATGAHGVAGEVRLKLLGDGFDALKAHKSFNDGSLTLTKLRSDNKGGAIGRFAEIADRTAAEKLRGTQLKVTRETLPPLEEGEYYHADLMGLAVVNDAGACVGKVVDVQNYGATDVIEIKKDPAPEKGMKTFMIPMTKQAVIEWDSDRMVVSSAFCE